MSMLINCKKNMFSILQHLTFVLVFSFDIVSDNLKVVKRIPPYASAIVLIKTFWPISVLHLLSEVIKQLVFNRLYNFLTSLCNNGYTYDIFT